MGLVIFIVLLATLVRRYVRSLGAGELRVALAGTAGLAVLVGVLAKNSTDDFFSRAPLFDFWLLNGMLIAVINHLGPERAVPAERPA